VILLPQPKEDLDGEAQEGAVTGHDVVVDGVDDVRIRVAVAWGGLAPQGADDEPGSARHAKADVGRDEIGRGFQGVAVDGAAGRLHPIANSSAPSHRPTRRRRRRG